MVLHSTQIQTKRLASQLKKYIKGIFSWISPTNAIPLTLKFLVNLGFPNLQSAATVKKANAASSSQDASVPWQTRGLASAVQLLGLNFTNSMSKQQKKFWKTLNATQKIAITSRLNATVAVSEQRPRNGNSQSICSSTLHTGPIFNQQITTTASRDSSKIASLTCKSTMQQPW